MRVEFFAMTVMVATTFGAEAVAAAQYRHYPASNCYTPGQHDEGDYIIEDGRFRNQGEPETRRLWCPMVDDEVCHHDQWLTVVMHGEDNDENRELVSVPCVHEPMGGGISCGTVLLGANQFGSPSASNPSYTGPYSFVWDTTLLGNGILLANFASWYPILVVDLPNGENVFFSGYRTYCTEDPRFDPDE